MKLIFSELRGRDWAMEEVVKFLTLRYRAAYDRYLDIADENADLNMKGGRVSKRARLDEERAFDALDVARQALLDAAAQAFPTIH